MRDASLGIRRGVVVQNLPPISTLLEEERERSARGHRVTAPQREARRAKREIEREGAHAHLVERERIAELARREVGGLVPVVQLLPAVLHVAARDIARQRVLGVIAHEARQIAVDSLTSYVSGG